jgi:hypothetical protein
MLKEAKQLYDATYPKLDAQVVIWVRNAVNNQPELLAILRKKAVGTKGLRCPCFGDGPVAFRTGCDESDAQPRSRGWGSVRGFLGGVGVFNAPVYAAVF